MTRPDQLRREIEPDELRRDIEQARTDLSLTVEALAARADVKARAREAADEARARALDQVRGAVQVAAYHMGRQRERLSKLDPRLQIGLAAVAGGLLALLVGRSVLGRRS